jgi:hypothetical protein
MSLQGPRAPLENRLLKALPRRERERLRERLDPVYLPFLEPVYDAGGPIPYVYFPLNGVFSLVAEEADGVAEVGTVGNEGLVGLPVFFGTGTSPPPLPLPGRGGVPRPAWGRESMRGAPGRGDCPMLSRPGPSAAAPHTGGEAATAWHPRGQSEGEKRKGRPQ